MGAAPRTATAAPPVEYTVKSVAVGVAAAARPKKKDDSPAGSGGSKSTTARCPISWVLVGATLPVPPSVMTNSGLGPDAPGQARAGGAPDGMTILDRPPGAPAPMPVRSIR